AVKGEFSMAATFSKNTPLYELVYVAFQATFAAITCCLILGAFAERAKFSAVLVFMVLWFTFSYAPIAHMVWFWMGPDAYTSAKVVDEMNAKAGLLWQWGALDFAGGTVVHINAGAAALVAALVLGPRKDYARQAVLPHHVPFTLLGAGLLWFGWFGFNGGSALAANGPATLAFVNTMFAPAATLVVWTLLDFARTGRATAVGAATAAVVGLVAITPAAGFVSPVSAILLGGVAAFPSYFALLYRARTRLDDSLDVVAAHGLGGTVGALLTGVLAQKAWNGTADGLLFGNPRQLAIQAASVLAVALYSGAATFGLLKLVGAFAPLRATAREEGLGLDVTQHGEEAYARGEGAILVLPEAPAAGLALPEPAAAEGPGL
ncbi:MAG TPA: ammonium transporter, partial [Thermoanaerobaculia bacterium]|nr:ammonium transporter [Thermoanaerobaculia bacterium]